MKDAYKEAGVDITAGNEAVERMKQHVERTRRPEVLQGLGGFGGLFQLNLAKYRQPVLVSGTDGVGTKLKVAYAMDRADTVGIDLVAMCVNDVVVQGAEPLFFLDYIGIGKVEPTQIEGIVKGIADGCQQAGCSLIGGETAEMPGIYQEGEYDLAGFAVGIVEKDQMIDGSTIEVGDQVLALPSTGVHSNGFSLVRYLLEKHGISYQEYVPELSGVVGDVLLTPTRIYVPEVLQLVDKVNVKGLAHITGGGIIENIPRVLPAGVSVRLNRNAWPIPPIFTWLQQLGELSDHEMYRTFNMGVGMVIIVAPADVARVQEMAKAWNEEVYHIGEVIPGQGEVELGGAAQ
ncbi:phosphoribosylformylglycinamidine cyclo-ligase [Rubeoparvulum massiliense]|uniref:phosphoribosylformylglycinamidine cyclo-ligase n=1 Tax=Rubeoparvulum massiliense TaxID=1631346 RepID=UPI00065E51E1|nr:phosphoribosylformylglycinamidine cyclo-ligase [Rubeoparvulum massiliense]